MCETFQFLNIAANFQIPYINAYVWNLERWYQRSYIQGSKGDTDVKNKLLDSVGEGKGGMTWENSTEIFILSYLNQITRVSSRHEAGHQTWRDGLGRTHTYGQLVLVYGKNHHNIIKRL